MSASMEVSWLVETLQFRAEMLVNRGPRVKHRRSHPSTLSRPLSSFHRMSDQTYDDGRARNLEALLRALAQRIHDLDADGKLLEHAGELTRLIGDVRSELFHYEVRATYDTPEVAENRRIVDEAKKQADPAWKPTDWKPDDGDDPKW
jgi:hypothetical protein